MQQILMRRRSFHSRRIISSKGSILDAKFHEAKVVENNVLGYTTLVRKELQLYMEKPNVFKDIINIFYKPEFLFAAFSQKIHGKKVFGNMTNVCGKVFLNISNSIVKGQFNFTTLSAKSKIPKEDKVVLKAMTAILEVI